MLYMLIESWWLYMCCVCAVATLIHMCPRLCWSAGCYTHACLGKLSPWVSNSWQHCSSHGKLLGSVGSRLWQAGSEGWQHSRGLNGNGGTSRLGDSLGSWHEAAVAA